ATRSIAATVRPLRAASPDPSGPSRLSSPGAPIAMKAREIMTADPSCCHPHDPVTRAATLMAEFNCGCLPVVEPGTDRIVGILTDRDIALRVVAPARDASRTSIEAVMSRGVVCCHPDDDIED